MRILIAPDKFKGALNAREVAENIAGGIHDVLSDADIEIVPMADGGEGTAEVICHALRGSWLNCKAHDLIGREIKAHYCWVDKRDLAVMEMSEAAGMRRLQRNELDPDRANTFGVGEMILDASKRGAREIIIGLGGSATNDGGSGMARALGFRFLEQTTPDQLDRLNRSSSPELELSGALTELQKLTRIAVPWADSSSSLSLSRAQAYPSLSEGEDKGEANPSKRFCISLPKIVAAVDVTNPLLGQNGATRVFGPQKGATPEKINLLERALTKLADIVAKQFGFDYRNKPGAGAAGGLGFGLMAFCGAQVRPGFDIVAEAVELESRMENADLVITGEGSLDRQTLAGKTPFGVAQLARRLGKAIVAVVGRSAEDPEISAVFDKVFVISDPEFSEKENIARAAELLRVAGSKLGKTVGKIVQYPGAGSVQ